MKTHSPWPALRIGNVRQFIAFRVFFNARFYYPVFSILFLDFGLTLDQFAILNAVWAASIVTAEVPLGALADAFGRRNLLIAAGIAMVLEILLLCVAPVGRSNTLFAIFLFNRALSGIAEAAASGADEALAYDSLKTMGDVKDWDLVLERQMQMQAVGFIFAMSLGAMVYDPHLMQVVFDRLGMNIKTTQELTLRFPLVLTLVMAFLALRAATRMSESGSGKEKIALDLPNRADAIKQAFKLTFQAGAWILKTPFALVVILSGLLFDHVIRMLITMSSQYYRSIYLPEASFGLIGSGLSVIGLFVPALARRMARRFSPVFNFCILSALTFAGLLATSFVIPYAGLIPMIVLFALMMLVGFFVSYYLNQVSESSQRATVLSFKGLSLNLAYGFIGILYSFLLAGLRHQAAGAPAIANGPGLESLVFVRSLGWFPWYFAAAAVAVCLFSWRRLKAVDLKAEDIQGQPPAERPPPMP